jgi:hypothetical protein
MPSAEMSSSEIRPTNSGNTWPPGTPQEVTPAEYIVQVDEGVWKRYSSHYEFPLSLLLAVGIHLMVFMLVLAFMSLSYYFGSPVKPIDIQTFVPADSGPGTHPHERSGGGGGERAPFGPLSELEAPKPEPVETRPPDQLVRPVDHAFQKQVFTPRDPGKGGSGTGGGLGDGHGTGHGNKIGPGRGGMPWGRDERWRLRLSYDEPEAFVEQLSNLQVVVALRMNSGRFRILKRLPTRGPFEYEEMTAEQAAHFLTPLDRLGFVTQDRISTESFAAGVNLAERPHALFIYIPKELEQALLDAEIKYHRLTEEKIRERRLATHFDVRREGSGWVIKVIKSQEERRTPN